MTTEAALAACAKDEHDQAARNLIGIVYADGGRRCTGGTNDGDPCDADVDCPPTGTCDPLNADMRKCQKLLGKTVVKQANKRLASLQSCKKKQSKDKLPRTTDCTADQSAKLSDMAKSVAKIDLSCTEPSPRASVRRRLPGPDDHRRAERLLALHRQPRSPTT